MAELNYSTHTPIGRKIAKVRKLHGWTQEELAKKLGTSKSAVSRLENSFEIEPDLLKDVCEKLEVTVEGLNGLEEDNTLYFTANFYDHSSSASMSGVNYSSTYNNNPLKELIQLYEKQLKELKAEFKKISKEDIKEK